MCKLYLQLCVELLIFETGFGGKKNYVTIFLPCRDVARNVSTTVVANFATTGKLECLARSWQGAGKHLASSKCLLELVNTLDRVEVGRAKFERWTLNKKHKFFNKIVIHRVDFCVFAPLIDLSLLQRISRVLEHDFVTELYGSPNSTKVTLKLAITVELENGECKVMEVKALK